MQTAHEKTDKWHIALIKFVMESVQIYISIFHSAETSKTDCVCTCIVHSSIRAQTISTPFAVSPHMQGARAHVVHITYLYVCDAIFVVCLPLCRWRFCCVSQAQAGRWQPRHVTATSFAVCVCVALCGHIIHPDDESYEIIIYSYKYRNGMQIARYIYIV